MQLANETERLEWFKKHMVEWIEEGITGDEDAAGLLSYMINKGMDTEGTYTFGPYFLDITEVLERVQIPFSELVETAEGLRHTQLINYHMVNLPEFGSVIVFEVTHICMDLFFETGKRKVAESQEFEVK